MGIVAEVEVARMKYSGASQRMGGKLFLYYNFRSNSIFFHVSSKAK